MKIYPQIVREWREIKSNPLTENLLHVTTGILAYLSSDDVQVVEMRSFGDITDQICELRQNTTIFFLRVRSTILLANLIGHTEDHPLLDTDKSIVEELVAMLVCCLNKELYGGRLNCEPWEPLQCLSNICVSDRNKR